MAQFQEIVQSSLVAKDNAKLQEAIQQALANQMESVDSEAIAEMGYNSELKIATVEFNVGGGYEYFGISPELFDAWINSASIGQYFNAVIKSGFFPFVRI